MHAHAGTRHPDCCVAEHLACAAVHSPQDQFPAGFPWDKAVNVLSESTVDTCTSVLPVAGRWTEQVSNSLTAHLLSLLYFAGCALRVTDDN